MKKFRDYYERVPIKLVTKKLIKVMKLTLFLFMLTISQLFATETYSQMTKLTLKLEDVTISDALKEIENQSEFFFLYSPKLIDVERKVNIDAKKESIVDILSNIFGDEVKYSVYDRQIILCKSDVTALSYTMQQQKQVTGSVTDKTGAPLPGVNVIVTGTAQGKMTDIAGKYTIEVPQGSKSLTFSFIGMVSQEITIGNLTKINVTMAESAIGLEEVIIVGYGTQQKANLTGAVAQTSSEVFHSRPIVNLGQGLQGVIANLNINQSSYAPGQGANFNIRGYTSINGGSPLILVDGVVQDPNLLDPNDIESVSVLKDAASAAIYGARAAYGVILITTKRGAKDQKPTLNITSSYTITRGNRVPSYCDSKQYLEFVNYASMNTTGSKWYNQRMTDAIMAYYNDPVNNLPVIYDPAIDLDGRYQYVGNTDWKKELYKDGKIKKLNVSLAGGSDKTRYYFSYGNMNQEGFFNGMNDFYARNSIYLNISSDVFNWLSVSAKTRYTYSDEAHPAKNKTAGLQSSGLPPTMPVKHPDGSWAGQGWITNPLAVNAEGGYNKTKINDIILTGEITVKPLKGLNFNLNYTFNPYSNNNTKYVRRFMEKKADGTSAPYPWSTPNNITLSNNNNYYSAFNAFIDYSMNISQHSIKILVGYNQETKNMQFYSAQRVNLIDNDLPAINRATGLQTVNGSASVWGVQGMFFRLNYDYAKKYLLEINGRYDGSSKFRSEDRFAFFPSISGAWQISNETFWDNLKTIISFAKIRGSYGSLGNQNVTGDFPYISSYGINSSVSYILGGNKPVSVVAGNLVSPRFTWEKVNQWDFGVDLGFLSDRLTASFDIYQRNTIGMLTAGQTLPAVLGTAVPSENAGDLKTVGWDLTIDWRKTINDFSFDASLSLSDNKAEITKFTNPTGLLSDNYVGKKVGEIWGYDVAGLFQSNEEIAGWPNQSEFYAGKWNPGDVKYIDRNNDKKITRGANTLNDPGDQYIIGNNTPRYMYGLRIGSSWRGIGLNLFIQGIGKRDIWLNQTNLFRLTGTNGSIDTTPLKESLDYWTPDNPDAYASAPYLGGWNLGGHGNLQPGTRYLQNAAYMRLKQVTIVYSLPNNLVRKVSMSNVRIYATMENILTFTKYTKLLDPELSDAGSYPVPFSYNVGIDVTF